MASFSSSVVNVLISFGLLLLYMPSYRIWDWNPPFRAPKAIISVFFLSNVFLVVVPFFPPVLETRTYENLPYWVRHMSDWCPDCDWYWWIQKKSHTVGGFVILLVGITYWYIWGIWLPKANGYRLQREWVMQADGISRNVIRRVPRSVTASQWSTPPKRNSLLLATITYHRSTQ